MWKKGQLITVDGNGIRFIARVIKRPSNVSFFLEETQRERVKGAKEKLPKGCVLSIVHTVKNPKSQKG